MTLKLDANETSLPFPQWLKDELAIVAGNTDLRRYPDRTFTRLRQAFAEAYGIEPEQVSVANGSGEALLHCFSFAKRQVQRAVWPWPTFGLYRPLAERVGLEKAEGPTPFPADLNVDELLAAGAGPALYVLTRPNNPSGYLWSKEAVAELADRMAPGSLLLIDEAYAEFAGVNLLRWGLARPNVFVVRTLSKAFGLAGMRVGFVLAAAPLAAQLEALRLPYPLDVINEQLAIAALRRRGEIELAALTVANWRDQLGAELTAAIPALELVVGEGPFIMVRHGDWTGPELQRRMAERGVLVRAYADEPELHAWIRISACAPADIPVVVAALKEVIAAGNEAAAGKGEAMGR